MSDYHTDINIQMNYWLADRAGLPSCFEAFADYCLAQLPGWSATTQSLFQDSRNGFRNSSGRVAGWTIAISTNVWGGGGWWWHPAGGAWISNTLYDHYLVHPGHRLPAEDLPAAQGRLPVLGGPADHRSGHRPADRRQRLVPGAGADQRQGHHLRAGTGLAAVRELRRGGGDTRPGRRLRGHDQRPASQALPAAGQPDHRLAGGVDDP